MRRNAMVLVSVLATSLAARADDFDYTVTTGRGVDEAVKAVSKAAEDEGLKVPGTHPLPVGDPYVIVELCDPSEAKKLVAVDPRLGLLLPCGKVAVYKDAKDGGKTKLSLLLPAVLTRMHPAKEVKEMARRLDPRFRKVVDAAR